MSRKRGLGRGLGALIPNQPDDEREAGKEGIQVVSIDAIEPNPHQPRGLMDPEKLAELAQSIEAHGLIQPLIVTKSGETYTLIAGERRWRACRQAGVEAVPVIVKEATPQAMLELALIENIQRADLNPLEEAHAYQQLMEEFGLTQAQVSQRVGKARSTVANLVRLLELPANVQQAVSDGEISGTHARVLLQLNNPAQQMHATNQIIKLDLSVRQTETLVANLLANKKPKPKQKKKLSPEMATLQSHFEQSLGAPVKIQQEQSGGRVIIRYYSDEELNAIYEAIVGEVE